jgi:DNA-binding IclR family transcriptional regulator
MADIEHWIDLHETELRELAQRTDMHDDTVHFLATLVLAGWTDDAIYEQLHELIPSSDGQRNPLESAPALLEEVRRLAATS